MRNRTRTLQVAASLVCALLVAGCAASPANLAESDNARRREIARSSGMEPAGSTLVDMDGDAALVDPVPAPAPVGRPVPAMDPDTPVSSAGQITPMPAPDTPVPSRPVGSGSGGAAGGGSAGMDPGVAYPTAPAAGAGSAGSVGVSTDLLLLCGEDENVHGEGRSPDRRKCLWSAYLSNQQATFRTVAYTTEGDPIAYDVSVQRRDHLDVRIDSKDHFGAMGQFAYTCTSMELTGAFSFVLKGCTPSDPDGDRAFLTEDGELHIP